MADTVRVMTEYGPKGKKVVVCAMTMTTSLFRLSGVRSPVPQTVSAYRMWVPPILVDTARKP